MARRASLGKRAVLGLVERGGKVRTFHIAARQRRRRWQPSCAPRPIAREPLMTDESKLYIKVGEEFAGHETV